MNSIPDSLSPRRLYVLAGIPGCGKSTWATRFFWGFGIVSSDAIREEKWPGEEYDHTRNAEVFDEFHNRIEALLEWGEDAVADATSLTAESRTKLRLIALKYGAEFHLIFFDNVAKAIVRNEQREGNAKVPSDAMLYMVKKFNESRSAILEEEYTSITIIEDTA